MKKIVLLAFILCWPFIALSQPKIDNDTTFRLTDHLVFSKSPSYVNDSFEIVSPSAKTKARIYNGSNGLYYQISYKGNKIIEPSYLGLKVNDSIFSKGFMIDSSVVYNNQERVRLYLKEKDYVNNNYHALILYLKHISGRTFTLEFRLFDNSLAFRYEMDNSPGKPYIINADYSEFSFSKDLSLYYETTTESGYTKNYNTPLFLYQRF